VTELEEFALDALVARGIVLFGHPFDQCGDRRGEGWATEAIRVLLGHQEHDEEPSLVQRAITMAKAVRLEDVAMVITESCERRRDLWSRFGPPPPPQVELGRCLEL
jgi:hypothetical protein